MTSVRTFSGLVEVGEERSYDRRPLDMSASLSLSLLMTFVGAFALLTARGSISSRIPPAFGTGAVGDGDRVKVGARSPESDRKVDTESDRSVDTEFERRVETESDRNVDATVGVLSCTVLNRSLMSVATE